MTALPFQMSVNTIKPNQAKETLTCTKLLREVPNKRYVYKAAWNGKNVIAKVFNGFGSDFRLKKEWNGLQELLRRKLNAPQPCFYGTTNNGCQVLVTMEITNASTAAEIYQNETAQTGRYNLLILVVRELAKLNNKGVLQKDIHLGNFLISGEQVFSLDAGQMVFYAKPLSRKKSRRQLAAILTFSPDEQKSQNLCLEYAKIRNWDLSNLDEAAVKKYACSYRKYVVRRVLKKTLRTSKHFIKVKKNTYTGMFSRKFIGQSEPSKLFEQIDELMDNGQILKKGNTCYVSRITWANSDIVVKRYNYKGFFEERKGLIIRRSYIITEYVNGENLHHFLQDNKISKDCRSITIRKTVELIENLHKNGITHRDLKLTNILITNNGSVLTDLDAMKVHKVNWICRLKEREYLKQFMKNAGF